MMANRVMLLMVCNFRISVKWPYRLMLAISLSVFQFFLISTSAVAEEDTLEITGRLRSLFSILDNNHPLDGVEMLYINSFRLMGEYRADNGITWELHAVESNNLQTGDATLGMAGLNIGTGDGRYHAFDLTSGIYHNRGLNSTLSLDRFNATVELPSADITIGRQPITFGTAYFWNPLDVFLPFNSQQTERDYKSGVDAVRIDIPLGVFSGVNVIGALGREIGPDGKYAQVNRTFDSSWYASALMARYFTTINGWDYSIQSGKVYGGYQLGAGFVGESGPYQIRGEAAYLKAKDSPPLVPDSGLPVKPPFTIKGDMVVDNFVAVIGAGRYFDNSLDIEVEYLYNGAGDPGNYEASFIRMLNGGTLQMGRHLLGAMASYDIDPLTKGRFIILQSLSDGSTIFQPLVTVSIDNNTDLQVGATIALGEAPSLNLSEKTFINSEFGTSPNTYFLDFQHYF